jgi:hypothetical protein
MQRDALGHQRPIGRAEAKWKLHPLNIGRAKAKWKPHPLDIGKLHTLEGWKAPYIESSIHSKGGKLHTLKGWKATYIGRVEWANGSSTTSIFSPRIDKASLKLPARSGKKGVELNSKGGPLGEDRAYKGRQDRASIPKRSAVCVTRWKLRFFVSVEH